MAQKQHSPRKVVWITGASNGIGAALALRLAREGWVVAATARSGNALEHLRAAAPQGALFVYPGDVCDAARCAAIVGQIVTHHGQLGLAVLNAGIYEADDAQSFAAHAFTRQLATNLGGIGNTLAPVLDHFRRMGRGHVALTASVLAHHPVPGALSYGATKAAVQYLARGLAHDLRGSGIKVQLINPGFVNTGMTAASGELPLAITPDEAAKRIVTGLRRPWFEITFPKRISFAFKLLHCLPRRLAGLVVDKVMKDRA